MTQEEEDKRPSRNEKRRGADRRKNDQIPANPRCFLPLPADGFFHAAGDGGNLTASIADLFTYALLSPFQPGLEY